MHALVCEKKLSVIYKNLNSVKELSTMDSMMIDSNEHPFPEFDQSSITYLNLQTKRLNDFSMSDSSQPKGFGSKSSKSSKEDDDEDSDRYKIRNVRYSNNQSPERPHSQSGVNMMREQENIIGELKKECFGLKLRIYYMEEQLRDTFDANVEDILKDNVELKVAVEELKNELMFKTDLLTKASQALMSEGIKQHDSVDGSEKASYLREIEKKDEQIKHLEEEVSKLNEKLSVDDKNKEKQNKLQRSLNEKEEKYKLIVVKKQQDEESLKSMICELEQTLATKESNIETLRNDLRRLASNKPDQSIQHYKMLYEKTGKLLAEKESKINQLQDELATKSDLIDSLNEHIASFDEGMKETQLVYEEKEKELQQSIFKLRELIKKQQDSIKEKGNELHEKDNALTKANEKSLLVNQQKVQYELDTLKTKESQIIELEIKVKQQNIDLERTLNEHNISIKDKGDDVLRLQGLYLAAQQEIKRLKNEEKECKALNEDLKKSLEQNLDKERSLYANIEGLLLKPGDQKELEVSSEFIKSLQNQLKEKELQISEMKTMKDEVIFSASHKHQKLQDTIMDLNKALVMKDKEINNVNQKINLTSSTNLSEHNTLLSALLREKNEKDSVIQSLTKSVHEKDVELNKVNGDSESILKKNKQIDLLKKQIKELKALLAKSEKEKINLDAESRALKFQKESLQKQLTNFNTLLSSKEIDTSKDDPSVSKLENLAKDFESVIGTYKSFIEKLNNNQHPESQIRVLEKEITEIEHTRENFQSLLISMTNKSGEKDLSDIMKKDKALKVQLEESRKRTISLEEQLFGISKYQRENESLKKDLIKYEGNERKLKDIIEQMGNMKEEYDQIVSEREEEISILMKNMSQEKQVTELLTQQKEMLSQQLDEKQKKMTQDTSTLENAKLKLSESVIEFVKLESLIETKENCVSDLQEEIESLQKENSELISKHSDLQTELHLSNDTLSKITSDLKNAELNITSLESQLNTSLESGTCQKRTLKKDVKELFEMNVRLRKKVKAYDLVIEKKDTENGKLKEQLEKASDTTKKLEILLSNTNDKTALEGELQYLRDRIKELENDNSALNGKINEIKRISDTHEEASVSEIKKMKELVDVFTDENVNLKTELHKMKQEKSNVIGRHVNDLDEKNEEIFKLQTSLDNQKTEVEEKTHENKMLEYGLNKKTKESEDKANEIITLKNTLQKQTEMINARIIENTKLQGELDKKIDELNVKIVEVKRLKASNDKQSFEINEKESEFQKLQSLFQKQLRDLEEIMIENEKLKNEVDKVKETLADNKLSEKLTAELIASKSLINNLQSKISSFDRTPGDVLQLKNEILCLKEAKQQLKEENKRLKQSSDDFSHKLSFTLDDNNIKIQEIKVLKTQMGHLEEKIESFTPLYTSSANNIALSSDAFTQTEEEICQVENSDSLIMQHIKEMQQLRKQLEDTINNNDSLRAQLEERLNEVEQEASLMQDPQLRITLIRDNDTLRMKLAEANGNQKKLKQQIDRLKEEKESDSETITTLNSQIHELNVISTNLKMEMEVYNRLIQQLGINKSKQISHEDLNTDNDLDKNLLLALLEEIRDLRDQLQLTIDVNNQLREKLEEELGHPVPEEILNTPGRDGLLKTPGLSMFTPKSLFSGAVASSISTNVAPRDESVAQNTQSLADYPSLDETPTKDIGIELIHDDESATLSQEPTTLNGIRDDMVSTKMKELKMLKDLSVRVYEKLYFCLKKLKSQKEKSSSVINDITEIMKLSKQLSKLISSFQIFEKTNDKKLDESTCEFEIASKLLRACDTLKATKGNLQLRNTTSRPVSRNHSPNH